ncbi:MAG TPA: SUMF1/EgtB/PvdO family nonheme iron enzyme, partial [Accumulibacter sp.]|uniref:SUMF1/EgtB/PvdO family nonheme iron enzyme n=1 Tax=Accumulibacter sp. TaxID=2053492 RepID=UPI002C6578D4
MAQIDIPAGRFHMGSPPGEAGRSHDEGTLHEVTQDAFACMRHPVTRGLYRKLMPEVKRYWPEKDADGNARRAQRAVDFVVPVV